MVERTRSVGSAETCEQRARTAQGRTTTTSNRRFRQTARASGRLLGYDKTSKREVQACTGGRVRPGSDNSTPKRVRRL